MRKTLSSASSTESGQRNLTQSQYVPPPYATILNQFANTRLQVKFKKIVKKN